MGAPSRIPGVLVALFLACACRGASDGPSGDAGFGDPRGRERYAIEECPVHGTSLEDARVHVVPSYGLRLMHYDPEVYEEVRAASFPFARSAIQGGFSDEPAVLVDRCPTCTEEEQRWIADQWRAFRAEAPDAR